MHALVIGDQPFTRDRRMQPAIAIASASRRVRLEAGQQLAVVDAPAPLVASGGRTQAEDATRARPQTGPVRVEEPSHRSAFRNGPTTFCHHRPERLNIERLIRHDLLQAPVLVLEEDAHSTAWRIRGGRSLTSVSVSALGSAHYKLAQARVAVTIGSSTPAR